MQRRRAARVAAQRLARSRCIARARRIALYLPLGAELDTRPLMRRLARAGRSLYVPRVDARVTGRMSFVEWREGAPSKRNRYGIDEPARTRRAGRTKLDVVVLPLVGFDAAGHRLGSGAGYYDRWWASLRGPRPKLVGYAYSVQEVDAVPFDSWDLVLDAVCTERGFRYRGRRSPTG